jgi:hypothetical protein
MAKQTKLKAIADEMTDDEINRVLNSIADSTARHRQHECGWALSAYGIAKGTPDQRRAAALKFIRAMAHLEAHEKEPE